MRTIAIYLPQFHKVKENDEWWGEGYSDWVAVKWGEPLFEGHEQPKVPLNNNYYDLLSKDTMLWQAQLAEKYGIDGFCFYHYYFKDGRKILEKPAENLLKWKDINMPFCFCWASATWARSWSKIYNSDSWGESLDKNIDENNKKTGILIEQDYGDEKDWEKHFYYLLPFFKDNRYIKYEEKPVFVIYSPEYISCLFRMRKVWDKLAKKEGLKGIYIIGANVGYKIAGIDDVLLMGPISQTNYMLSGVRVNAQKRNNVLTYDYCEVCKATSESIPIEGCKTYLGLTVNYDDTPRRGKKGYCFYNASPELFEKYFSEVLLESKFRDNEFVFLNAWNEWGEGNYLEPDERNAYQYLEAVRNAKKNIDVKICEYKTQRVEQKNQSLYFELWKTHLYRSILNKWIEIKEKRYNIQQFFKDKKINSIAIYGWGDVGWHLNQELKKSEIVVRYIIDSVPREEGVLSRVQFMEEHREVDAVIVTPQIVFEDIYNTLNKKIDIPIYSINEVIDYILDYNTKIESK